MIKLAKKIISKPNPYYDSSEQGRYANPIDAYLKEEVAFRLSRLFRKETSDENAIVFPRFAYKEKDREVCSMTLSFIVSSCENDILKDKGVFSIFQSEVWRIFNNNRIRLQHLPGIKYGLATYEVTDFSSMAELLRAITSTGCDIDTTFEVAPKEYVREETDVARVGLFSVNNTSRWEVYIRTDDSCQVPHFHVRNLFDVSVDIAITLHGVNYYPHDNSIGRMTHDELYCLSDFMEGPCKSTRFDYNYEYAVSLWNLNNKEQYEIDIDEEHNEVFIPDYAFTTPIFEQEQALLLGMADIYDKQYLERMRDEIKYR